MSTNDPPSVLQENEDLCAQTPIKLERLVFIGGKYRLIPFSLEEAISMSARRVKILPNGKRVKDITSIEEKIKRLYNTECKPGLSSHINESSENLKVAGIKDKENSCVQASTKLEFNESESNEKAFVLDDGSLDDAKSKRLLNSEKKIKGWEIGNKGQMNLQGRKLLSQIMEDREMVKRKPPMTCSKSAKKVKKT